MAPNRNSSVDKNVTGDVAPVKATPFQHMLRQMEMTAEMDQAGSGFGEDALNAVLTAETEEDIWDADERGAINFMNLADCEIQIIDIRVMLSASSADDEITTIFMTADGKKMYLLVTAVRLSNAGEKSTLRLPAVGEEFVANTSALNVVGKLWAFLQKGYVDPDTGKRLECVVKSIKTSSGNTVIKLRPMPRRIQPTVTE